MKETIRSVSRRSKRRRRNKQNFKISDIQNTDVSHKTRLEICEDGNIAEIKGAYIFKISYAQYIFSADKLTDHRTTMCRDKISDTRYTNIFMSKNIMYEKRMSDIL